MIPLVDLKRQIKNLQPALDKAIQEVVASASFINGPHTQDFETRFAQMSGASYGVGTSSGTSALYLALKALGIGSGDEVITVSNTFIATTEAITRCGATPRFVDIDARTYTMDPKKLAQALTASTKAIVPVALFGQTGNMAAIQTFAQAHHLKVVMDAAQAHLAMYQGRPCGAWADVVCYSFFPGKNLGAFGDAGMLITSDKNVADRARMLANHGRQKKYMHQIEGFNDRMDEIQAAVLQVKLDSLQEWTERRRANAVLYNQLLLTNEQMQCPHEESQAHHVYHLYVVRCFQRDAVKVFLNQHGIAAGVHYPLPLHLQPAYALLGYQKGDFPVTEQACAEILSLPMFPELTAAEIKTVSDALQQALEPSQEVLGV